MSKWLPTKFGVLFVCDDYSKWWCLPRVMAKKLALRRGINLETYDGGIDEYRKTIHIDEEHTSPDLIEIYHDLSKLERDLSGLIFQPYPEEVMSYVIIDNEDDGYMCPNVDTKHEYKTIVEAYMTTGDEKKLHEAFQKIKEIERLAELNYYYEMNNDNNTEK